MGILNIFKKKNEGNTTKTAEQRKKETEELMKSLDIPYDETLPILPEESDTKIRTAKEIAERILILEHLSYSMEVLDEPEERALTIQYLKDNSLWKKTSPKEKELFKKESLTKQEITNMRWLAEDIWLLLWITSKVDTIEFPTDEVDATKIVPIIPEIMESCKEFIKTSKLRSTSEILDMADLLYRLHWSTRNAYLNNLPMPADLDEGVIRERHYAINWVIYNAKEWDEITTNT